MAYMLRLEDQPLAVHHAALIFGSPLRLGIIRQLILGKESRIDIAKALGVSEDTLTRQMGKLLEHGLVEAKVLRAKGRPVRYTVNTEAIMQLFETMGAYWQGKPFPAGGEIQEGQLGRSGGK